MKKLRISSKTLPLGFSTYGCTRNLILPAAKATSNMNQEQLLQSGCSIFDFNFLERCKNRQIMFITVQLKHSSAFLPPRDSFCCLFSASYCSNGSMLSRKSCVLPQFLSPKGFQGSTPATKKIKNSINTVFHVEKKVGYVQYHLLHHLFY